MVFWKRSDDDDEGDRQPQPGLGVAPEALSANKKPSVEGPESSRSKEPQKGQQTITTNADIKAETQQNISASAGAVREAARSSSLDLGTATVSVSSDEYQELLSERFGKLRSALGQGTVIQGKLTFDNAVRIDGKLSGEVYSSKALIVGEAGVIEAEIKADSLVVMGVVKGTVKVRSKIEILPGGRLEGEIETPCLVVLEGGILNGNLSRPPMEASVEKGGFKSAENSLKDRAIENSGESRDDKTSKAEPAPAP